MSNSPEPADDTPALRRSQRTSTCGRLSSLTFTTGVPRRAGRQEPNLARPVAGSLNSGRPPAGFRRGCPRLDLLAAWWACCLGAGWPPCWPPQRLERISAADRVFPRPLAGLPRPASELLQPVTPKLDSMQTSASGLPPFLTVFLAGWVTRRQLTNRDGSAAPPAIRSRCLVGSFGALVLASLLGAYAGVPLSNFDSCRCRSNSTAFARLPFDRHPG